MSQTILTAPAPQARPDYSGVSDAMLYDIARHNASVLSAKLMRLSDAADSDEMREHWAARRRLVKQQARVLNPEVRAEIIAQDEVWLLEKLALTTA
ncbi:hypothetical protein ACFPZL_02115 [Leucobacter soli]|uniref:Uncharacterized protein n=1 Tax=Leucobacter soli TaxID=2812850 RepID=A0A916JSW0_9MICO|nr:hypothetical protein [Leucobacter soli]CAG7600792.1 hypothetical protein LEUCIP111803_00400 [Leucobacter soli]